MRITPRNEADAVKAAGRTLLPAGWHDARIVEAVGKQSKRGNDMIEITCLVPDGKGAERTLRDWIMDSELAAAKLRHACEAVGALAKYEAGEIEQADFPGHSVRVKVRVE